jgi:RNA polymerase sigma factor (TIGR02999 family)
VVRCALHFGPKSKNLDAQVAVEPGEITRLLREWRSGNQEALHELMPLVYKELRRTARAYLARERHAESWQPTMLVNDAFLRLVDCRQVDWQDRGHFFRLAAKKMREILVDYFRKKRLQKMGGSVQIVPLEEDVAAPEKSGNLVDLILLDSALERLAAMDPRQAQIVEMRFFAGLSIEDIAETMDMGVSTVHHHLHLARVWLYRAIVEGKFDES